jgi:hypothetical protein
VNSQQIGIGCAVSGIVSALYCRRSTAAEHAVSTVSSHSANESSRPESRRGMLRGFGALGEDIGVTM